MTLSFELAGAFLPAAINDKLEYTIDYDVLCRRISEALEHHDCHSFDQIKESIRCEVRSFSSLISHGSLWISLDCHDAFQCHIDVL